MDKENPVSPTSDAALEAQAVDASIAFSSTEEFPSLSSIERQAFHYWFAQGFVDAAKGRPRKEDWTSAFEGVPGASYNRDCYNAGYGEGEKTKA